MVSRFHTSSQFKTSQTEPFTHYASCNVRFLLDLWPHNIYYLHREVQWGVVGTTPWIPKPNHPALSIHTFIYVVRGFLRDTGVRLDPSAVAKPAPALDWVQYTAYDAPHSEWRGMGRLFRSLLMTSILSKHGSTACLKAFQSS